MAPSALDIKTGHVRAAHARPQCCRARILGASSRETGFPIRGDGLEGRCRVASGATAPEKGYSPGGPALSARRTIRPLRSLANRRFPGSDGGPLDTARRPSICNLKFASLMRAAIFSRAGYCLRERDRAPAQRFPSRDPSDLVAGRVPDPETEEVRAGDVQAKGGDPISRRRYITRA